MKYEYLLNSRSPCCEGDYSEVAEKESVQEVMEPLAIGLHCSYHHKEGDAKDLLKIGGSGWGLCQGSDHEEQRTSKEIHTGKPTTAIFKQF